MKHRVRDYTVHEIWDLFYLFDWTLSSNFNIRRWIKRLHQPRLVRMCILAWYCVWRRWALNVCIYIVHYFPRMIQKNTESWHTQKISSRGNFSETLKFVEVWSNFYCNYPVLFLYATVHKLYNSGILVPLFRAKNFKNS